MFNIPIEPLLETIASGIIKAGWVILPLMIASLVGWFIIFQRAMVLSSLDFPGLIHWRDQVAKFGWEGWVDKFSRRNKNSIAGQALLALVEAKEEGRHAMESKLDEVMKFRVPELEKSLSTLAILATAAPLMGLLGTVSGIVRTFQVISAFGTGNQALMSDSISESLMATQNGLLVAFPLLLMHVYLSSKAAAIEHRTMAVAHAFINSIPVENNFSEYTDANNSYSSLGYST